MRYLTVKNWRDFQHYKDRAPPWIKLHRTILGDHEFCLLSDESKAHLMLLWLYASDHNGRIPADPDFLSRRIECERVNLDDLIRAGFLLEDQEEVEQVQWPTRYVPKKVQQEVFARDQFKCVACGSQSFLEIDHVMPVSLGGDGSKGNLQVLCRSCNRSKRTKTPEQWKAHVRLQKMTAESCVATCYADGSEATESCVATCSDVSETSVAPCSVEVLLRREEIGNSAQPKRLPKPRIRSAKGGASC